MDAIRAVRATIAARVEHAAGDDGRTARVRRRDQRATRVVEQRVAAGKQECVERRAVEQGGDRCSQVGADADRADDAFVAQA